MDPVATIREHAGARRKLRVERNRPSEPRLNGYVLSCSESLFLMHVFHDFQPEGYVVARLIDVVESRSGPNERFWDEMLAAEGLLDGLDNPPHVDLSSMEAVIASVHREFGRMIVECEDDEEAVQDFYIGVVARQGDGAVLFHHFDGLGNWERPSVIAYDEITMVQIETPYMGRIWRYLRGTAPPREGEAG